MKQKWRDLIFKFLLVLSTLSIFAAVDAHASTVTDLATVCIDSDYTDPTDYHAIRAHKMSGGANSVGTNTPCVEQRSKAFIIKSQMIDEISHQSLSIKAIRIMLCNFDRLFQLGLGVSGDPFEVLHAEPKGTTDFDWVKGKIREKVNGKLDEKVTPGSEGLEDQCKYYGANDGAEDTTLKREMQRALKINVGEAVSTLFCGDQSMIERMTPEQLSMYLVAHCQSPTDEAVDVPTWLKLERKVRNARQGKHVPTRDEVDAYVPTDNCPTVQPDKGRIFTSQSEAYQQCERYGSMKVGGKMVSHCPSVQMPGPQCGTYYAKVSVAAQNCDRYGTDLLPSGAARFYCPAKTRPGPNEGTYYATIAAAVKNCDRYGTEKAPHGAARFYCPPNVVTGPDGSKLFAHISDATQFCSVYGTSPNPNGFAQFYCPPKQEKAQGFGMWYASNIDASQACTTYGSEESYFHSVHYFCPEQVQGIYRAKTSALGNCRNIGSQPDRGGSTKYYCRDR